MFKNIHYLNVKVNYKLKNLSILAKLLVNGNKRNNLTMVDIEGSFLYSKSGIESCMTFLNLLVQFFHDNQDKMNSLCTCPKLEQINIKCTLWHMPDGIDEIFTLKCIFGKPQPDQVQLQSIQTNITNTSSMRANEKTITISNLVLCNDVSIQEIKKHCDVWNQDMTKIVQGTIDDGPTLFFQ